MYKYTNISSRQIRSGHFWMYTYLAYFSFSLANKLAPSQDGWSSPGCGIPVHCLSRGNWLSTKPCGSQRDLPLRPEILEEEIQSTTGKEKSLKSQNSGRRSNGSLHLWDLLDPNLFTSNPTLLRIERLKLYIWGSEWAEGKRCAKEWDVLCSQKGSLMGWECSWTRIWEFLPRAELG